MMSTSDSDYSVDWLASDEEDYASPSCIDTQAPLSATTRSSRDSPRKATHSGPIQMSDGACDYAEGHWLRPNRESRGNTVSRCPTVALPSAPGQRCPCGSQTWVSGPACEATITGTTHLQGRKRPHSSGSTENNESPKPEDAEKEMFSLKCMELQCYIHPLSSILHGLRAGRYSERLSSVQESVAMDRIQRILGVLQNPNIGERFLSIILKIEKMLQSWFPHTKPSTTTNQTEEDTTPAMKKKHPSAPNDAEQASRARDVHTSVHLKWLPATHICALEAPADPPPPPPPRPQSLARRWDLEATQDSAVSSSTDSPAGPCSTQPALPFKISSPCLERLLQAKESIIAPRTVGDEGMRGWSSLS